jgi:ubiquinone/menaquinone biosynthesis C-methylase UbiE
MTSNFSPPAGAKSRFKVKLLADGRAALNLGCGTRMHWSWNNLDSSPYIWLAHHPTIAAMLNKVGVISGERYQRLQKVDPEAVRWHLAKGIPFADNTFDVVYHAHLLEHLEREAAPAFLKECLRVLKKKGIIRIVVPDLEILTNRYHESLNLLKQSQDETAAARHAQAIDDLFEQMVRGETAGARQQRKLVRVIENLVRGDAAKTGELHRWMYDAYSLTRLLTAVGFKDIRAQNAFSSQIAGWTSFNLDTNADGSVNKPESLYLEGVK